MKTAQQELRRNYRNPPKPTPNFIDVNTDSQSIVVNAPVSEVYRRCLRFEEFPRFITSIKRIERIDDTRFSYTSVINGQEVKAVITIMMRVPDRRIAWQVLSGHLRVGVVALHPLPGGGTKVTAKVRSIIEPVLLTGALRDYLSNFKRFVEQQAAT